MDQIGSTKRQIRLLHIIIYSLLIHFPHIANVGKGEKKRKERRREEKDVKEKRRKELRTPPSINLDHHH